MAGRRGSTCVVVGRRPVRRAVSSRSRSLVLRSELLYTVALTVVITLASAAPITVPATPKNEATTAEVAAASALPITCSGLRPILAGRGSAATEPGRAADMSSVWSRVGWPPEATTTTPTSERPEPTYRPLTWEETEV